MTLISFYEFFEHFECSETKDFSYSTLVRRFKQLGISSPYATKEGKKITKRNRNKVITNKDLLFISQFKYYESKEKMKREKRSCFKNSFNLIKIIHKFPYLELLNTENVITRAEKYFNQIP
ncbi:hypothetical protein [Mycoplasmopsis opalescens]|uniref:hypothetical protein n=1 Tax=Mycoplasmopsis opalescens TaxID=114886 RepID=UPI0004A74ABC|nr:hypothetical protein [Mycoplasmopsis opalescens]